MTEQSGRRMGRPPVVVDGMTARERLLDVARDLFAEHGFDRTSVQDLVAAAGVTKGAMYHYFASKDDLLAEIYGRVLRMQTSRLEAYVGSDDPIAKRVADAAADVVTTTIHHLPSTTVYFQSLHQLNPQHEQQVRDQRRRYHDMFRTMIISGQESGVFRTDVVADLVVDYYFGAVHHLPMWWRDERGLGAEEVGRKFSTLLIDSLMSR